MDGATFNPNLLTVYFNYAQPCNQADHCLQLNNIMPQMSICIIMNAMILEATLINVIKHKLLNNIQSMCG